MDPSTRIRTEGSIMRHHYISLLAVGLSMLALLNGCAGPDYRSPPPNNVPPQASSYSSVGVIEAIDLSRQQASNGVGGALVGGAVGGVLGNQVGSGNGRTVATVAGAVGGALVGNNVQKNNSVREVYTIRVRMNDGSTQTLAQDSAADLRIGDRVRVDGGRVYRY